MLRIRTRASKGLPSGVLPALSLSSPPWLIPRLISEYAIGWPASLVFGSSASCIALHFGAGLSPGGTALSVGCLERSDRRFSSPDPTATPSMSLFVRGFPPATAIVAGILRSSGASRQSLLAGFHRSFGQLFLLFLGSINLLRRAEMQIRPVAAYGLAKSFDDCHLLDVAQ